MQMQCKQMQFDFKSLHHVLGTLVVTFALAVMASAQSVSVKAETNIENFGQMDARFYRGAQPKKEDFKDLAALGINTVIDLRADTKGYEQQIVESLGMKYVNIPMVSKKYPTEKATQEFLKVVSDPQTGKFFVHCAGGRHRTGAMGAVYRFQFYNWNIDQAYNEMKQFDFYTSRGHQSFKDFVEDYYANMLAKRASEQTGASLPIQYGEATETRQQR